MEFNIALNTVLYLMIFIFPGILFRKFFYIREYSKEFGKGNLFERFIWTLLCSITILFIAYFIYWFAVNMFKVNPVPYLSYNTVKNIFEQLSNNNLPNNQDKNLFNIYSDFSKLIFAIYLLSAILGVICYGILRNRLFKSLGFFKHLNYWEDLTTGIHHKIYNDTLSYSYTLVDVLANVGEGTKLYSGTLVNYYLSHENNQLQTIILKDAVRYKKYNDGKNIITDIPGHIFIIEKEQIHNLNFTYIFEDKAKLSLYRRLNFCINMFTFIAFISIVLSVFFGEQVYTYSGIRKFIFVACSLPILLNLNDFLKILISKQWSKLRKSAINFFIAILLFGIPYIWIFHFLQWNLTIALQVLLFILATMIIPNPNKGK